MVVIDDFFSHEALQELRDFLLESTIWTDVKRGAPAEKLLKIALRELMGVNKIPEHGGSFSVRMLYLL